MPVVIAMLVAVLACGAAGVLDASRPLRFGHDLITPYTVGRMVLSGDGDRLYDAPAVEAAGRQVLTAAHLVGDPRQIHWLNPGWFAAPFVPLALLPYRWALVVWTALNAGLFTGTLATLLSWLPDRRRTRLAFAATVATSCPFLLAFGHQQNTFLSLALVVAVVSVCRRRVEVRASARAPGCRLKSAPRPGDLFRAGLLAGLLAYKPQLAVGVGLVLLIVGGRKAIAGMAVGGLAMLVLGEVVAPGSTVAFARAVPPAVAAVQADPGYNWGRQVTPTAFWRTAAGPGGSWAGVAATATTLAVLAVLAATAWRRRRSADAGLANLLGLAVLALPLSAPYFMDYDLLLLAAPAAAALGAARPRGAVLRAVRPALSAAGVAVGWAALWLAAYANADAVASAGVNIGPLAVAALFATTARTMWSARRPATTTTGEPSSTREPNGSAAGPSVQWPALIPNGP